MTLREDRHRPATRRTCEAGEAEGRTELAQTGFFAEPWGQLRCEPFVQSLDEYVAQLCSYGNVAGFDVATKGSFVRRVRAVLDDEGLDMVEQTLLTSVCVARKAG